MSDDPNRIRVCGVANCNVRMSAVYRDPHVICPLHTGFQCNMEQRCSVCSGWSVQMMQDYVKLQEGKARRKAHKDRKRAQQQGAGSAIDGGRPAHSLSPSSNSSAGVSGETVPSLLVQQALVQDNCNFKNGGGMNLNIDLANVNSNVPSVVNPPSQVIGDSGYLGQVSAVPHSGISVASKGKEDPGPLMVPGDNPRCVGQPPQTLTVKDVGQEFSTPSTSGTSVRTSSSFVLTVSMYNSLKGVLDEHKEASDQDKMHLMLKAVMDKDPAFSGSRKSGRSHRSRSVRSDRTEGSRRSKSTVPPTQSSLTRGREERLEIEPVRVGESIAQKPRSVSPKPRAQVELSREWARMVETGGVKVLTGASCFYKDKKGVSQFVSPPTGSIRGGRNQEQKLGPKAFSVANDSSPNEDVTPGIEEPVPQSQGSEGGTSKASGRNLEVAIPRCLLSPRIAVLSPNVVSEESGGVKGSSVSPRRLVSPRLSGLSPRVTKGGAGDDKSWIVSPGRLGSPQASVVSSPGAPEESRGDKDRFSSSQFK